MDFEIFLLYTLEIWFLAKASVGAGLFKLSVGGKDCWYNPPLQPFKLRWYRLHLPGFLIPSGLSSLIN